MQRKGIDTSLVNSGNSIETEENSKCVDETKTSLVDLARLTEQWHQLSIQKDQFCTRRLDHPSSNFAAKNKAQVPAEAPWGDFLLCLDLDTNRKTLQRTLCGDTSAMAATNNSIEEKPAAIQVHKITHIF